MSESVPASPTPALTFVVCSNRIGYVQARWGDNLSALGPADRLLVVVDLPHSPQVAELVADLDLPTVQVIVTGRNRGLSYCRNAAMDLVVPAPAVFLDDDVRIASSAVERLRDGFRRGANIVGARLGPPGYLFPLPWYMTEGQLHLLGVHSDRAPAKTWGACMGIDTGFAAAHGLRFPVGLGRRGNGLQSGDDTSFVAAMKTHGAVEHIVDEPSVLHEVNINRRTVRYLLRRAFWQGRSEVRRAQAASGLSKEWTRYSTFSSARRTVPVGLVYLAAVLAGVITEQSFRVARRLAPAWSDESLPSVLILRRGGSPNFVKVDSGLDADLSGCQPNENAVCHICDFDRTGE